MSRMFSNLFSNLIALTLMLVSTTAAIGQSGQSKKVFMITDMEGVDGIFNSELQCNPLQSPRFEESRKLLTGEINAAVDGLLEGGATEVVVWDGHDGSKTLSTLDIHPKARLLMGTPVSSTLELNSSYNAVVFIGQHAMAGAEKGVLSHSYSSDAVQNIWVNNKPVGEIGARVMLAGTFGIPVVMLSGDAAACKEIHQLVPQAECAEVKQGVSRTTAFSLSHPAACSLIHEKARRAMERLAEFKPYRTSGPVEVKVQLTPKGTASLDPAPGIEQLDERTWVFRGKDIIEAWLKYSSF
jgi:D-amino peptidase